MSDFMTHPDLARAEEIWAAFESACAGLLANKCKRHMPYMGCPLDCNDVENAIEDEWNALRPLIPQLLSHISAQSARIAELEAERNKWVHRAACDETALRHMTDERDALLRKVATWERIAERDHGVPIQTVKSLAALGREACEIAESRSHAGMPAKDAARLNQIELAIAAAVTGTENNNG